MAKKRTFLGRLWRLLLIKLPLALIALSLVSVIVLKWCPILVTPTMIQRSIQFRDDKKYHTHYKWVRYKNISPEMARAVMASEDNLFDKHNGFDWKAIKEARQEYESGKRQRIRGASTISQQTAKNVFLFQSRSWCRKGLEAYFTVLIEALWSKERIMEVYLNVIEMGKGIYGSEAAAEQLFGTTAAKMTRQQCCLIAACLPNPLRRNAARPTSYLMMRANQIAALEPKLAYPDWVYHKEAASENGKASARKSK